MESTKSAFVVIAELQVPAEHRDAFLQLCQFDSEHSVAGEPGCRQFDVITQPEAPETIVLYEVYDDRAAFDAHLTMPHYAAFAEGVERFHVEKTNVRFFTRHRP